MDNIDRRLFPIFRLPKDAQYNVLQTMEVLVLLTFTLCSKATKSRIAAFIQSIRLPARNSFLTFDEQCILKISYNRRLIELTFVENPQNQDGQVVQQATPQLMSVDMIKASISDYMADEDEGEECTWVMPNFTVRDWLNHFLSVVDNSGIDVMEFEVARFDPDLIHEVLKGIEIRNIEIYENIPNEYSRHVLYMFFYVDNVELHHNPFDTVTQTRGFLTQNLFDIRLWNRLQLTLDDLLVTNSRYSYLYRSRLAGKDINRFLKLWKLGSNPRLMSLIIIYEERTNRIDRTVVLSGLQSLEVPGGEEFEIYRRQDGRRGIIRFCETFGHSISFSTREHSLSS